MNIRTITAAACISACFAFFPSGINAAGTLVPVNSGEKPAEILSHDVSVVINNGFAKTEVTQQFRNPNTKTGEAVYTFPLPKSASLSEVTVQTGEEIINGEVVDKKTADKIYGEEKDKGNNVAIATKDGYQDFRFNIANLAPDATATIRFVYYQPLPLDTGVCRYVYPLEEGNTKDEAALAFWERNSKVTGKTTLRMNIRSAWPLDSVRAPGATVASLEKNELSNGSYEAVYELGEGLAKDFVFYYQLAENLPGRLELIPYRSEGAKEGSYMMVLTPGIDLKKIENGADYVFVLDRSGSMSGDKIRTLCEGVAKTIGTMQGKDRFRIIAFETNACDLTSGWIPATAENVKKWIHELPKKMNAGGGTNLYAGIEMALNKLDADRVTSVILVTDGVTNTGVVSPKEFHELLKKVDVRVFGFLMGNQSNWPLMRTICSVSGGFYEGVSNSDDIIGKIMLAKSKILCESLHDVQVKVKGVKTFDTTGDNVKKLYLGQQLVIFGRYANAGRAVIEMQVKYSGREQTYRCRAEFPEKDTDNPELERLWAMSRIEQFEDLSNAGLMPSAEANDVIKDLGLRYQLVTDETSMLVLSDDAFRHYNIERKNQDRIRNEHRAQSTRAAAPVKNYRADIPNNTAPVTKDSSRNSGNEEKNNMFEFNAPRLGGGKIEPFAFLCILALVGAALAAGMKKEMRKEEKK